MRVQATQSFAGVLTVVDCARCGIVFGITADLERRRREDHKGFSCPNGHSNAYNSETKAERLERQLAGARDYARRLNERVEREKRAKSAAKGQLTKLRNRIANEGESE